MLATSSLAIADGTVGNDMDVVLKPSVPASRPKAPAKETVYMTYDPYSGMCTFSMSPAIESMQVLIENSAAGIVIYEEVTQESPVIDATLPGGNYSITCTANTGSVFEATFSLTDTKTLGYETK